MSEQPRRAQRATGPDESPGDESTTDEAARFARDPLAPRRGLPESAPSSPFGNRPQLVIGIAGAVLVVIVVVLLLIFGTGGEGPGPTSPSQSSSPSPTSTPSPAGVLEVVGDTSVTLPAHWRLEADEITEADRRLIRVIEDSTDVRLQVATLTTVGSELRAACQALIDDQGAGYTVDFQVSPTMVSVPAGGAVAVNCGFQGVREGAVVDTNVLFTMMQRESDSHTLVLRVMQPVGLPVDTPATREVAAMVCEATIAFGHPLPLCSP